MASSSTVTYQNGQFAGGVLKKLGGAPFRIWQTRFVYVIHREQKVQYAKSKGAKLLGEFSMVNAHIFLFNSDAYGKDYTFGIRPDGGRRMYVFAASSEDEENAWVVALKGLGGFIVSDDSGEAAPAPAVPIRAPVTHAEAGVPRARPIASSPTNVGTPTNSSPGGGTNSGGNGSGGTSSSSSPLSAASAITTSSHFALTPNGSPTHTLSVSGPIVVTANSANGMGSPEPRRERRPTKKMQSSVFEGWLMVMESSRVWARRYFVLSATSLTVYNERDDSEPLARWDTAGLKLRDESELDGFSFSIQPSFTRGKKVALQADTADDRELWLSSLAACVALGPPILPPPSSSTSSTPVSPSSPAPAKTRMTSPSMAPSPLNPVLNTLTNTITSLPPNGIVHSGNMRMQGEKMKEWTPMYFVLAGSLLLWFENEAATRRRDLVPPTPSLAAALGVSLHAVVTPSAPTIGVTSIAPVAASSTSASVASTTASSSSTTTSTTLSAPPKEQLKPFLPFPTSPSSISSSVGSTTSPIAAAVSTPTHTSNGSGTFVPPPPVGPPPGWTGPIPSSSTAASSTSSSGGSISISTNGSSSTAAVAPVLTASVPINWSQVAVNARGIMPLWGCNVVLAPSAHPSMKWCFAVHGPKKILRLCCDDEESLRTWAAHLNMILATFPLRRFVYTHWAGKEESTYEGGRKRTVSKVKKASTLTPAGARSPVKPGVTIGSPNAKKVGGGAPAKSPVISPMVVVTESKDDSSASSSRSHAFTLTQRPRAKLVGDEELQVLRAQLLLILSEPTLASFFRLFYRDLDRQRRTAYGAEVTNTPLSTPISAIVAATSPSISSNPAAAASTPAATGTTVTPTTATTPVIGDTNASLQSTPSASSTTSLSSPAVAAVAPVTSNGVVNTIVSDTLFEWTGTRAPPSSKYLRFFLAAADFISHPVGSEYQSRLARRIYNRFFAHGALQEIFIDTTTRLEILETMHQSPRIPNTLFAKAQSIAVDIMAIDVLPRYLQCTTRWSLVNAIRAQYDRITAHHIPRPSGANAALVADSTTAGGLSTPNARKQMRPKSIRAAPPSNMFRTTGMLDVQGTQKAQAAVEAKAGPRPASATNAANTANSVGVVVTVAPVVATAVIRDSSKELPLVRQTAAGPPGSLAFVVANKQQNTVANRFEEVKKPAPTGSSGRGSNGGNGSGSSSSNGPRSAPPSRPPPTPPSKAAAESKKPSITGPILTFVLPPKVSTVKPAAPTPVIDNTKDRRRSSSPPPPPPSETSSARPSLSDPPPPPADLDSPTLLPAAHQPQRSLSEPPPPPPPSDSNPASPTITPRQSAISDTPPPPPPITDLPPSPPLPAVVIGASSSSAIPPPPSSPPPTPELPPPPSPLAASGSAAGASPALPPRTHARQVSAIPPPPSEPAPPLLDDKTVLALHQKRKSAMNILFGSPSTASSTPTPSSLSSITEVVSAPAPAPGAGVPLEKKSVQFSPSSPLMHPLMALGKAHIATDMTSPQASASAFSETPSSSSSSSSNSSASLEKWRLECRKLLLNEAKRLPAKFHMRVPPSTTSTDNGDTKVVDTAAVEASQKYHRLHVWLSMLRFWAEAQEYKRQVIDVNNISLTDFLSQPLTTDTVNGGPGAVSEYLGANRATARALRRRARRIYRIFIRVGAVAPVSTTPLQSDKIREALASTTLQGSMFDEIANGCFLRLAQYFFPNGAATPPNSVDFSMFVNDSTAPVSSSSSLMTPLSPRSGGGSHIKAASTGTFPAPFAPSSSRSSGIAVGSSSTAPSKHGHTNSAGGSPSTSTTSPRPLTTPPSATTSPPLSAAKVAATTTSSPPSAPVPVKASVMMHPRPSTQRVLSPLSLPSPKAASSGTATTPASPSNAAIVTSPLKQPIGAPPTVIEKKDEDDMDDDDDDVNLTLVLGVSRFCGYFRRWLVAETRARGGFRDGGPEPCYTRALSFYSAVEEYRRVTNPDLLPGVARRVYQRFILPSFVHRAGPLLLPSTMVNPAAISTSSSSSINSVASPTNKGGLMATLKQPTKVTSAVMAFNSAPPTLTITAAKRNEMIEKKMGAMLPPVEDPLSQPGVENRKWTKQQLPITPRTLDAIASAMKTFAPGPHVFLLAQREIFAVLRRLWPLFKQSPAYTRMVKRCKALKHLAVLQSRGRTLSSVFHDVSTQAQLSDASMEQLPCHNGVWTHFFSLYVSTRFCLENVVFFNEAEDFANAPGPLYRALRANRLYDKFIKQSSEQQVNIPANVPKQILKDLHEAYISPALFGQAQREAYKLMQADSLPGFLCSDFFSKYLCLTAANLA